MVYDETPCKNNMIKFTKTKLYANHKKLKKQNASIIIIITIIMCW